MKLIKYLGALGVAAILATPCQATVRLDIKNDTSEDCSLAVHARIDKAKWLTIGWYVFASGEEAPIILDNVSDVQSVYVYNDCQRSKPKGETKRVWVRTNLQFEDEIPRTNEQGYEEVTFVRLTSEKYTIQAI
ncbi:MAG: DUF1036 domain-containing protein [Succinivibrio sp.]|nr:DUF1036 domain-containing protein [Succinivibrio sp.]